MARASPTAKEHFNKNKSIYLEDKDIINRHERFSAMGVIHLYFQEAATKFPGMCFCNWECPVCSSVFFWVINLFILLIISTPDEAAQSFWQGSVPVEVLRSPSIHTWIKLSWSWELICHLYLVITRRDNRNKILSVLQISSCCIRNNILEGSANNLIICLAAIGIKRRGWEAGNMRADVEVL